jgi:3'(2'), 5'-bisphosphate nucleotidase
VKDATSSINPGAIRITVTTLRNEDALQQAAGCLAANDVEMLACIVEAERKAGAAIMTVYRSPVTVEQKADRSPVTAADRLSHEIVTANLKRNYAFPVLSEEGKSIEYDERRRWDTFWLVDPLDGTKEFISGNGEFTVNVALIRGGEPVMGVIYVPAKDLLYCAVKGGGAYKIEHELAVRLPLKTERKDCTVVGSRSHASREFEEYVRTLRTQHEDLVFVSAGSSLKFCLVAEGPADLYPRLGTTMEWDTAAGQVIVEEAGGRVVAATGGRPLRYNKADLRNPHFIARGRACHD